MLKRRYTRILIIGIMVVLAAFVAFKGCTSKPQEKVVPLSAGTSLTIMVGTDLHYLSSQMTDHGELFTKAMAAGDGKYTAYCEEITDAFLEEVKVARPDALILSGDLTFNGEENSHQEMAEKLAVLQEMGIPVLVLPGNHDIDYPYVYKYEGNKAIRVEGISSNEFKTMYKKLSYDQALERDKASFSYVYELAEELWILLIDSNSNGANGSILPKTLSWAEKQLQKAKENKIKVLTVTHENILAHSDLITSGFVLGNAEKVFSMFRENDVVLNLSGHIHIQHIAKENELYEITTSALSVAPNQYGILKIEDNREISYHVKSVDVASYAKKSGSEDTILLDFANESKAYLKKSTHNGVKEEISDLPLTQNEINDMADFAANVNEAYFAGTILEEKDILLKGNSWKLWQQYGKDSFWWQYLSSILEECAQADSYLKLEIG